MEYRELYDELIKDIATEIYLEGSRKRTADDINHCGIQEEESGFHIQLYSKEHKLIDSPYVSTIEITKRLFKMLIDKKIQE